MSGGENKVTDKLSRRACLLKQMSIEVVGLERIKEEYESYPDFAKIVVVLKEEMTSEIDGFLLQDGYLFQFRKLCIPHASLRDFSCLKVRTGGLASHFG